MKDKIIKVYNEYLKNYPELRKEKRIILCLEGVGAYNGKARTECTRKHPKGRMGAIFACIVEGELHYTTHASTLPDDPMGVGKFNDNTPVPTIQTGIYNVYSKLHHGRPAMEVGLYGETAPVIRKTGISTSCAINIHRRSINDYNNFAWSTGCITLLEDRLKGLLEFAGVTKNGKYSGSGRYIGKLIVDRSCISKELQETYQDIYKQYYTKVFNTVEEIVLVPKAEDNIPKWQQDGLTGLVDKRVIESPEYWVDKLGKTATFGEMFAVLNKALDKGLV